MIQNMCMLAVVVASKIYIKFIHVVVVVDVVVVVAHIHKNMLPLFLHVLVVGSAVLLDWSRVSSVYTPSWPSGTAEKLGFIFSDAAWRDRYELFLIGTCETSAARERVARGFITAMQWHIPHDLGFVLK